MCYDYGVKWKPNTTVHFYASVYVVKVGLTVQHADQQMTQRLSVRQLQGSSAYCEVTLRTLHCFELSHVYSKIQATHLNLRLQDGTMTGYQQYTDHLRNFCSSWCPFNVQKTVVFKNLRKNVRRVTGIKSTSAKNLQNKTHSLLYIPEFKAQPHIG